MYVDRLAVVSIPKQGGQRTHEPYTYYSYVRYRMQGGERKRVTGRRTGDFVSQPTYAMCMHLQYLDTRRQIHVALVTGYRTDYRANRTLSQMSDVHTKPTGCNSQQFSPSTPIIIILIQLPIGKRSRFFLG
jgi:hypothetical protein